ncbi:DUF4158 domain-containing protein [Brevibacillus laterosporus]|uniref:DUF4158 domain-containing protein n=1 Tax=Brevibacillus laterosporus TaxID=1465 RepID=UPI00345302AA
MVENFTFLPNEIKQVGNKSGEARLGFAVLFKFFQCEARFPSQKFEVPKAVITFIAKQVNVLPESDAQYDWFGRSITYHRTQIREFFGFRGDTIQDAQDIIDWLNKHVLYHNHVASLIWKPMTKKFPKYSFIMVTKITSEKISYTGNVSNLIVER